MIVISLILIILAGGVESINCSIGQQACGSTVCYNSTIQGCTNGSTIIKCINSCNSTCYSNSQYCYNNTKICNIGELVCNIQGSNNILSFPSGLTCYNSSQYICSNNALCSPQYLCGTQCLTDYNSACANNQTICSGFPYNNYYPNSNRYVNTCGPQQQCYDNTTNICLGNNGTVCPIGNQLCSGTCYNPQLQYCIGVNSPVYCLNNPTSSDCSNTSTNASTTTTTTITTTITITTTTIQTTTITTTTTTTVSSSSCCKRLNIVFVFFIWYFPLLFFVLHI